jgi:hypothetical protein
VALSITLFFLAGQEARPSGICLKYWVENKLFCNLLEYMGFDTENRRLVNDL